MESKQTAVEWLIDSLPQIDLNDPHYANLFEQAKQMEKEQIMEAYKIGFCDAHLDKLSMPNEYYNETYGK